MSILKILESSYYNKELGKWEAYVPQTIAKAVKTNSGSNVQEALEAIPNQINTAIDEVKGTVPDSGNTLEKLHNTIAALQSLVQSDDITLDTIQEIVTYIKENRDMLDLIGTNKIAFTDIVNNLTTISTTEGKVLDARQGKVLKDAITELETALDSLQLQSGDFATKTYVDTSVASAMPIISETAPSNPADNQLWLRPTGSIEV